jgi:hypothetical protein
MSALAELEPRAYEWIRYESDDRDEYGRFARATTDNVAAALNIPPEVAYRVLASLARKRKVKRAGRVQLGTRRYGGLKTGVVGWQLWEVYW